MVELDQFIEEGALAAPHLDAIKDILDMDILEDEMGARVREYFQDNVRYIEDHAVITAMLGATHVISAYNLRRVMQS